MLHRCPVAGRPGRGLYGAGSGQAHRRREARVTVQRPALP